jgi:hypothetical protein
MVAIYENPYCGTDVAVPVPGKDEDVDEDEDSWQHLRPHLRPELSPKWVQKLLAHCSAAHETPLLAAPTLATAVGIAEL